MTDFELVYMFVEEYDAVSSGLMNYTSIVFAFLAASYFFASSLNRWLSGLLLGIYSGTLFLIGMTVDRGFFTMMSLGKEIQRSYEGGNEALKWHSAAHASDLSFALGPIVLLIILLASYFASIAFFVIQRKSST